jgi:uncharacterized lipoprotein YajG
MRPLLALLLLTGCRSPAAPECVETGRTTTQHVIGTDTVTVIIISKWCQ